MVIRWFTYKRGANKKNRKYKIGAREYERLKSIYSHSEETRRKMSESHKGYIWKYV